jgi:hypothetical protein
MAQHKYGFYVAVIYANYRPKSAVPLTYSGQLSPFQPVMPFWACTARPHKKPLLGNFFHK